MTLRTISAHPQSTQDTLTEDDYREMYEELRRGISLADFVTKLQSKYSRALWSKWENNKGNLSLAMKNELRTAVGLDLLPMPLPDVAAGVDPDGMAYQLGNEQPDSMLLWASHAHDVTRMVSEALDSPRNPVTRGKKGPKGIEQYKDLFDAPTSVLRASIRFRTEVAL